MPPKKKSNEHPPTWLLVRNDKENTHHVITMEQVQNPTKKKIRIGDCVAFSVTGDRSDRVRGPIITIGYLFITHLIGIVLF